MGREAVPTVDLWEFLDEAGPATAVEAAPRTPMPVTSPAAAAMTRELVPTAWPHMSLASELESMLAPEWGPGSLVVDFLEAQGARDIRVGPWLQGPGEGDRRAGVREVQMLLPVPVAPMAPRTTRATVRYHISAEGDVPNAKVRWESVTSTLDTPFCDCYTILDQVVLSPAEDGITVQKEFCVQFSKGTLAKSMIESSVKAAQKKVTQVFLEVLRRRAGGTGGTDQEGTRPVPGSEDEDPSVTEVWELQRRKTLFHDTWQAPFLPHDGRKRWRWVDQRYCKHPWAGECSRQTSANSSEPPFGPPDGDGRQEAQWVLAEAPELSDSGGWQYAVDFYSSDARWGSSQAMCHCRRRLWRLEQRRASLEQAAGLQPVEQWLEQAAPSGAAKGQAAGTKRAAFLCVTVLACAAVVATFFQLDDGPTAVVFSVSAFGHMALVVCTLAALCDKRAGPKSSRLLHGAARWRAGARARCHNLLRATEDDI